MLWCCESICQFPARCARPGCASRPALNYMLNHISSLFLLCVRLLNLQIIAKGVGPSRGSRCSFSRTTYDALGSHCESKGKRSETLRCRLITEVRLSRGLQNLAETSGLYSADFFRSSETSAEPVVFSRATQVTANHSEWRDAVKSDFFSGKLPDLSSEDSEPVRKVPHSHQQKQGKRYGPHFW